MIAPDKSQTPLPKLLDLYVSARPLSKSSLENFRAIIRSFSKSMGRPAVASDLRHENIDTWRSDNTALEPGTARDYIKRIRSLWRFAFAHGLVADEPEARFYPRRSEAQQLKRQRRENKKPKLARNYPFNNTAKRAAVVSVRPGSIVPTRETTIRAYYDAIYCPMRLGIRSPRTKVLYLNSLGLLNKWLGRPATLADLTDETITAHLSWILENGRAPRTANKSRDQLLALWRYAARKRHVDLFPDVEPIPEYTRTPRAWSIEQLAKLIDVSRTRLVYLKEKTLCGVPHTVWWPTLFLLLYDTGIRIGAAMQLRCDDFDPATRILFVRAETQKHKADQALPVSEETAAALATCIAATDREPLFPWPYTVEYLYGYLKRLLKAAGLPAGRADKFHKIRKTSATMAEKYVGPGAATIHLGHSSPKVTERYLDRTMLPIANVAAALPRPILAGKDRAV